MGANATTTVADAYSSSATAFVAGVATQDFAAVRASLAPDVHLRALLPGGFREWAGADAVTERFERWFGDTEQFRTLETSAGEVDSLVRLRWRLRLQAERLGPGCFVVEQVAYCDANQRAISGLDLLCTGYRPEESDD